MLNNKNNSCFCLGAIGLIVVLQKFDVFKTSISAKQLSADSPSTETERSIA